MSAIHLAQNVVVIIKLEQLVYQLMTAPDHAFLLVGL